MKFRFFFIAFPLIISVIAFIPFCYFYSVQFSIVNIDRPRVGGIQRFRNISGQGSWTVEHKSKFSSIGNVKNVKN
jgi:hypothetical protein